LSGWADAHPRGDSRVAELAGYDLRVPHSAALVDEIAIELATWPGVRIERRADGAAVVGYEHSELGVLYPDRGVAELPFLEPEHDELIEHGDAEPAEVTPESYGVSHAVHGPSDVTAVLELFDRRYRDVRGEDDPYSSQDPA
jgi:Luciferase